MIQDIAPLVFDNSFQQREPLSADRLLIFHDKQMVVIMEDDIADIPRFSDILPYWQNIGDYAKYLFSISGEGFFLVDDSETNLAAPPGFALLPIDIIRDLSAGYLSFAGITAYNLYLWYKQTRFCGCCGMQMRDSTKERARICPNCGYTMYPSISPAVIVAITDGKRLLMAKPAYGAYRRFALIAGFVEIGETFEDTVRREAAEEVGVKVKNIRYYKSQPWAFTGAEMVGFFAELDGEDTLTLSDGEIEEARWFPYDEIPPNMPKYKDFSIAQEMIDLVRCNKHGSI